VDQRKAGRDIRAQQHIGATLPESELVLKVWNSL